jgi:hypothetical protein
MKKNRVFPEESSYLRSVGKSDRCDYIFSGISREKKGCLRILVVPIFVLWDYGFI